MADTRPDYASEVRFGLVMYGGVALAIYINGVANELYELACATPKRGDVPAPEGSTRAVYRRLSWLLRDPALRSAYLAHLDGQGADPLPPAIRPTATPGCALWSMSSPAPRPAASTASSWPRPWPRARPSRRSRPCGCRRATSPA